jgi:hypothetical protein
MGDFPTVSSLLCPLLAGEDRTAPAIPIVACTYCTHNDEPARVRKLETSHIGSRSIVLGM